MGGANYYATPPSRAEASLSRLKELNSNVDVYCSTQKIDLSSDLSFLSQYQCVIMTEASLDLCKKIDQFCRSQQPVISVSVLLISIHVLSVCTCTVYHISSNYNHNAYIMCVCVFVACACF